MPIKLIASVVIAALLMTGTAIPVSQAPGQGAQLPQPAASEAPAAATTLTEAEAIATALIHAGLKMTEVSDLRAWMDQDERVPHWEVQWRSGDWEYDYDIHPETGKVLEWEKDYEPVRKAKEPAATQPPKTQPPAAEEPKTEPTYLTGEKALAVALSHSGLTRAQISRLEQDFDRDDGRPEWDIEFTCDGFEYSYEIHAETGKILDWEKEWDD